MAELTKEEVQAVAENIPEIVEGIREISRGFVVLTAAVSAAAGAITGYFVAYKRLETKYANIAEEEIDQMRDHFRNKAIAGQEKPDLDELAKRIKEHRYGHPSDEVLAEKVAEKHVGRLPAPVPITEQAGGGLPLAMHPEEPKKTNVFEAPQPEMPQDEGWDYEAEKARRSGDAPYIISVDEQGEKGYSQTTFTYYVGDDVVCDERDKVVDSRDEILGEGNLDRFGHGSGDPNVVYIRNDSLGVDVEVVKSEKTYAEEVHGLRHAEEPTRRRKHDWDG